MSISNPTLAAFLLDNGPQCVSVSYEPTVDRNGKKVPADIKSFKTFDRDLKEGDLVVIPTDTRWGFTVGKVTAVNVRVNYASHEQMRWVASKVDEAAYADILKQEEALIAKVAQAQEHKAKRELADELRELDPNLTGFMLAAPTRDGGAEPAQRGGAQPDTNGINRPAPETFG